LKSFPLKNEKISNVIANTNIDPGNLDTFRLKEDEDPNILSI